MVKKVLKITGRVLLFVLLFITIGILLLHTRPGKNFVRKRVQAYLYHHYKVSMEIGALDYRLPDWLALHKVLLKDQSGDTLLFGGELRVDMAMLQLLSGDVNINRVYLADTYLNLKRTASDSGYNFQFLVDAFSSKESTDTTQKPKNLTIQSIEWKNIRMQITDQLSRFYLQAQSDKLVSRFEKTAISRLSFAILNVELAGTSVNIIDSSLAKPVESNSQSADNPSPLVIRVSRLGWKDVSFQYENINDRFRTNNHIDSLGLREVNFNLAGQQFGVNELELYQSNFDWQTFLKPSTDSVGSKSSPGNDWKIDCAHLDLRNNEIHYHNNFFAEKKAGVDYNHLDIRQFSLQASNNLYDPSNLKTLISSGSLTVRNGPTVKNIRGDLIKMDSLIELKDPLLETNYSLVKAKGLLHYVERRPVESFANLNFDSSYIGWKDVEALGISDKSDWPVSLSKEDQLYLDGSVNGSFQRMKLDAFSCKLKDGRFLLAANGVVNNLDQPRTIQYRLSLKRLFVQSSLLSDGIKRKIADKKIEIPVSLTLTGHLTGNLNQVNPDLQLQSSFGYLSITGHVDQLQKPEQLTYEATIHSRDLATGKWVRQDSLAGNLTASIYVKGHGTNPEQLTIYTKSRIEAFRFKEYTYQDIDFEGNYHRNIFDTRINANDPHLQARLNLEGIISNRYPVLKGNINIARINLDPLGWSKDSISIASNIKIDIADLHPYTLAASIYLDSTVVERNGKAFISDTLSLNAYRRNDSSFITLLAPFASASLQGAYDYEGLYKKITEYISREKVKDDTTRPQQADFSLRINEHPLLLRLLPDLHRLDPVRIDASFHSDQQDSGLTLHGNLPHVDYGTTRVKEGMIQAQGKDTGYLFSVKAKEALFASTRLNDPVLSGQYQDSLLKISFVTNDQNGNEFYGFGLEAILGKDKKQFKLSDNLLLNHQTWDIDPKNSITYYADKNLLFEHFYIGREKQSLRINNVSSQSGSPIKIGIDSFRIANLLYLLNSDSLIADGSLTVDATIRQPVEGFPAMEGSVDIQNLTLQKTMVGDLRVSTQLNASKLIQVNGQLSGPNQADIRGEINVNTQQLDVTADLKKLTAKVIETASGGRISRTSGSINGNIKVSGPVKDPRWTGYLNFDSTQLVYTDFNVPYRLNRQQIRFDYPFVTFNNFTITDSAGHPLTISGTAKAIRNTEFDLNLAVKTNDFIAINAPASAQGTLSGLGIIDADLIVKGSSSAADIQGRAILEDKSNISFTVPQANNYLDDRKSVVVFVDMDTLQHLLDSGQFFHAGDTVQKTELTGIRYNLNLEVKENAAIKIIIDPVTNDQLLIKGTAQLNAGVDENGKLGINGIYQLKEGSYNMTYQFLKRKFTLQPGGTITFTGSPTDGIADITAVYEVEASPSELLGNEVGESTAGLGGAFTQKIPFQVLLKIKGPLLKPQLEFDIRLKEGIAGVNSTLSSTIDNKLAQIRYDISAINKQVFALLILNRFIGEQSSDFFAGSGFNPSDAARRSVSKFLAEAVDQIASDLIKGVNIDLDLRNYESDQNQLLRTDLNVALSSNFLNDRLTISVGKNFTLEGSDPAAKTESSVQFIPDISTSYKLSKDGRYVLRAYRRNQYEAIMDGYFVETGITFSITMSYNRFKELFRKAKQSDE